GLLAWRHRHQRDIGVPDRLAHLGSRMGAVEHQRFQPPGKVAAEHRGALGAAHRADDMVVAVAVGGNEVFRRIAEPETEQRGHGSYCRLHTPDVRYAISEIWICHAPRKPDRPVIAAPAGITGT